MDCEKFCCANVSPYILCLFIISQLIQIVLNSMLHLSSSYLASTPSLGLVEYSVSVGSVTR